MEWIEGMNSAVNYIEEHTLEEPDLEEIGKLAGCSSHHLLKRENNIIGAVYDNKGKVT